MVETGEGISQPTDTEMLDWLRKTRASLAAIRRFDPDVLEWRVTMTDRSLSVARSIVCSGKTERDAIKAAMAVRPTPEFECFVEAAADTSTKLHVISMCDSGAQQAKIIRSARLELVTAGPFPWPPSSLVGKRVRVIVEDD